MSKKIILKEANRRLKEKHGDNIKMTNYYSINNLADFKCLKCGYEWNTIASSVINGGCGCDNCADKKNGKKQLIPINDVSDEIKSFGCKLLSKTYSGKRKLIKVLFGCGHIENTTLVLIRQMTNKVCTPCRKRILQDSKKTPEDIVISLVEKTNEFKFIGFDGEYTNQKIKIKYLCKKNHLTIKTIQDFKRNPYCTECNKEKRIKKQTASNSHLWRGGISGLSMLLEKRIDEWKQASMKNCNFKCVITGDRFDQIHHLYSMNMIISESLNNLNLDRRKKIGDYSDNEIMKIIQEVRRVHNKYPLGVCLRSDIHILFHRKFGNKNNTPEQFYDFQRRIESGEIKI